VMVYDSVEGASCEHATCARLEAQTKHTDINAHITISQE
jgi:hypothetical protein